MSIRTGITTGTCAAAAAKAAAMLLSGQAAPQTVDIVLPGGQKLNVPVLGATLQENGKRALAWVQKDSGGDADITHGMEIFASVEWAEGSDITFRAGPGVGTVTKPGLQVPPGEPAINPVPRQMIRQALRDITSRGACVEISIPRGIEAAAETFNPRLGVTGGLSILGTTGIVRPYCRKALQDALKCSLDVAGACGVKHLVLVPGNIGARAAGEMFMLKDEQLIEVSNEWDYLAGLLPIYAFERVLVLGHPGKLAKLTEGQWDTHSARSSSPVAPVAELFQAVLHRDAPELPTVEGIFAALGQKERILLGNALAGGIRRAIEARVGTNVAVVLVNMSGCTIGTDGDLSAWK